MQEVICALLIGLFNAFWCWFLLYQPTQYLTKDESKWGKEKKAITEK